MSIESESVVKLYSANGTTTNFAYPWAFLDVTDIDVYLVDEAGTVLGTAGAAFLQPFVTNYDVIGAYAPLTNDYTDFTSGGSINFVSAPATGYTVVILRNNPNTQDTSLPTTPSVEYALDKLVMMVQYLKYQVSRSIKMADSDPTTTLSTTIPNPMPTSSVLATNSAGTALVSVSLASLEIPGADGKTVRNGVIDPTNGVGVDGDFFINTVSNKIFGPKSGSWPVGVSLIGPTGATEIGRAHV